VKSEALICLYNVCENHNSKNLRNEENLIRAYLSVVEDYRANSPYILQIAISFCSLIAEKMPNTIEKYQLLDLIEKIFYSNIAQQN
jgi:hypothetical protein